MWGTRPAAMLTIKRSAGVAPEVILKNPLCAGKEVCKWESTLALKPRVDVTRSPKQGCQWPHKKDLCPTKDFINQKRSLTLGTFVVHEKSHVSCHCNQRPLQCER